jgi:EF-hand domain pair
MKILKIISISLICLILFNPLNANNVASQKNDCPESKQKRGSGQYIFSIHDIDKSGTLSEVEYQQLLEHVERHRKLTGRPMRRFSPTLKFKEIDINKDGYISEDEMISALNKRLQEHRRYRYKGNHR